ncbi:MAG: hypothetical protein WCK94_14570 [Comamonadaceae bacterium]
MNQLRWLFSPLPAQYFGAIMSEEFLLGVETVARGAIDAGIRAAFA